MRIYGFLLVVLPCTAIALIGCKRTGPAAEKPQASAPNSEPQNEPDVPPNVRFDIGVSAADTSTGYQVYDCTYQAGGKLAKFRLRLKQNGPVHGEIPMASANGSFIALDGSDNSVLLRDLKLALEAKTIPRQIVRMKELQFDAVILAEHQSESGGYCDKPCGDWTAMKLFLPKGGDDGEVYLDFNSVLGKAEFSIKDPDYGDYVLEQLAKVL